ncbi:MAG TPA: efflux RND transporter permease subunit [Gammaproteobacteria bacterium]
MWEITRIALRRPVTTVMAFISLAVIGMISARLLPLEFLPEESFPGLFIQVPYQGSSPEEVERLITRPIEEVIATMGGIERLESTSSSNSAGVFVFFGWGSDIGVKSVEVRDKINAIRNDLPEDLLRINIFKFVTTDQPILRLRISSTQNLENAYDLLDRNLKRPLERIEGVSRVDLGGVEPPEIRIDLISDRVSAHNIDLAELARQLQADNFSVTAGKITSHGERFLVHPLGQYRSLEDIRDVVVAPGVRLSDIANVHLTQEEREFSRHLDGEYAIALEIYRASDANMVAVANRVMQEIDRIARLPQMEGIAIFAMDNQAEGVTSSLNDVLNSGLVGAGLSLLVLFFFLRHWPTTLMVTLAVPFSLSLALAALYFMGLSLNILTMMGLMLAIGMLVDNAVVVSESIFSYKQKHPGDPMGAALEGTREVATAVFAGTLTTIIVFLPIIFGEESGITIWLKHVAVTIIFTLVGSLLLALTMIPMIAARIHAAPSDGTGSFMARFRDGYGRMLGWTLRHRWGSTALIGLIIAISIPAFTGVKMEMFPQDDGRELYLDYNLDGIYPLETVEENVARIENFLLANKEKYEIDSVYSWMGKDNASTAILLTEGDAATRSANAIRDELLKELPKIAIGDPGFDRNRQGSQSGGMGIELRGESTETLMQLADEVKRVLRAVPGVMETKIENADGGREIQVVVDRLRAQQLGLSTQDIATTIATAMRGINLRQFRGEHGEIDIRLAFDEDNHQSLQELYALPVHNDAGEEVLLSSVASLRVVEGPAEIHRNDRATTVNVQVGLNKDASMGDIQPRLRAALENLSFPEGYSWSLGRSFEEAEENESQMGTNFLLALLLIFIVMAALFEKILQPLAILTGILFSVIGVFWLFWLTGTVFSMMAWIGILILMGVVVNNGIVMLDHVNNLRNAGMERREAILQGAKDRLRPILMTVSTTVLGLLPLAMGDTQLGGGGPPYYPMARAIIGGLLFSTVVSLAMLPLIYSLFDDLGQWGSRVWIYARGLQREKAEAV